ncbi:HD-GYP domain-containing protein [Eubacterium oxidoreducens]|uniref:HD domain-containing protein n=1 Tax=Eubacterium oxidoreducens TaxID=1732 RepID=A0A1G6BBZ0_EUBOX|nr:HD domain-containing phosphohydrolase [Eubacterium oxidoreducens]SDB18192.1 HD domain-containing protein [Eubacterium oxidoreducens]
MKFVKKEELKLGMRIAKSIYNEKGVLLYERGSALVPAALQMLQNNDLFGVYILDATEPIPPMTDEEIEFERVQTLQWAELKKALESIAEGGDFSQIEPLAMTIENMYSNLKKRITFFQTLRGPSDQYFKHSVNVASLTCMVANRLNIHYKEIYPIICAALVHDVGKLYVDPEILYKPDKLTESELKEVREAEIRGYNLIRNNMGISATIRRYITQFYQISMEKRSGGMFDSSKYLLGTQILKTMDLFDLMTSMRIYKKEESIYRACCYLMDNSNVYPSKIVEALVNSIDVIPAGTCVELHSGEKGLVVIEGAKDFRKPTILSFKDNRMYDLSDRNISKEYHIKDILANFDNRNKMDYETLKKVKTT